MHMASITGALGSALCMVFSPQMGQYMLRANQSSVRTRAICAALL